jgi:hypothetical protein
MMWYTIPVHNQKKASMPLMALSDSDAAFTAKKIAAAAITKSRICIGKTPRLYCLNTFRNCPAVNGVFIFIQHKFILCCLAQVFSQGFNFGQPLFSEFNGGISYRLNLCNLHRLHSAKPQHGYP